MSRNWCEYFAAILRPYAGASVPVYSNVDPDRDYQGGLVIEISEGEATTTSFLSGRSIIERQLVVGCRAERAETALECAGNVRRILYDVLNVLEDENVASFAFDELDVAPDELGDTTGQSFAGYVKFRITETVDYP